jgi:hypothetical protein
VYCKTLRKLRGAIQNKRHGMLTSGVVLFPDKVHMSAYSCLHSSTAGAFKLGVVWPPSLQPQSHSERLLPVYLLEELVGITALQE